MSPRSEPLNLSSPLEVGEEVLVRYPSRTIDPGLSAISEMKKKKRNSLHNAPTYMLLPLGKWGSKWGMFNHEKGAI